MNIQLEKRDGVVTVRLHRPRVRNALDAELMTELVAALQPLDQDPAVGCFVITGDERAFAAGADITEMSGKTAVDMISEDYFVGWDAFTALRTPKLAAVAGYALGGGCELAMMCDTIYAATTATFGQPEITLGVIPGIGGTQRLTGLVGKAKAMDLILTGRPMSADEAERCGLVARTFAPETLLTEVQAIAASIAGYGRLAVRAAREAVERSLETSLREGLLFERRSFHALFATSDQSEGMQAFLEKRAPHFTGR